MSSSPRLGLDYLVASQAQKEITHNEALNDLDVLVQSVVNSCGVNVPPESPAEGDAYIIGSAPTGVWVGHVGDIAFYYSGWRFKTPQLGWQVFVKAEKAFALFDGAVWKIREVYASVNWNPGTVVNGAGITSGAIAVAGVGFGDFVLVAAPYDLRGVLATAYVNAAGSVVVRLHNATGGSIIFVSGLWKLCIVKG